MLDNSTGRSLFSLSDSNHLRLEAMELFEQCLTSGDESPFVAFIEAQLIIEPPRLELLHQIADDLQQRLLSLREYHFDVRDRVVRTFAESYGVDITPLTPSSLLNQYHFLTPDGVLSFAREKGITFSESDAVLLRKMVEASVQMAGQLYDDIQLSMRLHSLVLDWLSGMNIAVTRQHWSSRHASQDKSDNSISH
jgi:hypothetical protein